MIAFVLLLLLVIAFQWWKKPKWLFKPAEAFVYSKLEYRTPIDRSEYERMDAYLEERVPFYAELSTHARSRFIHRLVSFTRKRPIVGRDGFELQFEDTWLIAAAPVMLTFGLQRFPFEHTKAVWVYPTRFYNRLMRTFMLGGASKRGLIQLSWEHLEFGYADPDDTLNLALHEFAHALHLGISRPDMDKRFAAYFDRWQRISNEEMERLQSGKPSFLRSYAGTNQHEFFAVCVEHFFERPEEFKKALPDVYNHLCFLLNLNPLNPEGDYVLTDRFVDLVNSSKRRVPFPTHLPRVHPYRQHHWSISLILIGAFIGSWLGPLMAHYTMLPDYGYGWFYALALPAGYLAFYKKLRLSGFMNGTTFFFSQAIGFAPTLIAGFLLTNYSIVLDKVHLESSVSSYSIESGTRSVHFEVENDVFQAHGFDTRMPLEEVPRSLRKFPPIKLELEYTIGLFGLRNVRTIRLQQGMLVPATEHSIESRTD